MTEPKGSSSGRVSEGEPNDFLSDRYRKPPLFDRPTKVYRTENYLSQVRQAEEMMIKTHQQLIDAGYIWDGMDGYTAP